MPVPEPPLLTGDLRRDVSNMYAYLTDLATYLKYTPHEGWSTVGTSELKVMTSGDTLTHTQDVLGTLINTLIDRGDLSNEV